MTESPEMLIIRKEQMLAFSNYMKKSFEDRVAVHLRENFPKETEKLSNEELRGIINKGIESAGKYNIVRECDVAKYIELMFLITPDFDTNKDTPWARRILVNSGISGEEKIRRLLASLPQIDKTDG